MIAALLMYDRPETAAAHDALWRGVRANHGGELPERLTRGIAPRATWARADLALGHICGLPYRTAFRDRLAYVGTGAYDVDARPGHYRSVWIARATDARGTLPAFDGATFAHNERGSFSGFEAARRAARAAAVTFGAMVETGSHARSAAAVAEGRADIAAIDAISWRGISRHDAVAAGLRVVGTTPPAPGLAFVTAAGRDADAMRGALAAAIADLAPEHRDALGLNGLVVIPLAAYDAAHAPPET